MAVSWTLSCDHEAAATDADLERIADAAATGEPLQLPSRRRICPVCRRARDVVGLSSTNRVEQF